MARMPVIGVLASADRCSRAELKASLIVLARIKSGPDDIVGPEAAIELAPVRVLKGALPGDGLRLMGSLTWNGEPVPAMPTPLAQAHVSTGIGACVRMVYPKGGLVVAMFGPTPAAMKAEHPASMWQLTDPFARVVEDVESEDGVWVRAVAAYVALQAGAGKRDLRGAVERKRGELLEQTSDLAAQAMARDLAAYLDVSAGKPDRIAEEIAWKYFDLPDEAGAVLGSKTQKGRILRCRKGGAAVEVYWPEEEGAAKALRLGDLDFALRPAKLVLSPEMKSSSATVALDARLGAAMEIGTGEAGIATPSRTVGAPPNDILQKLALRCSALLGRD